MDRPPNEQWTLDGEVVTSGLEAVRALQQRISLQVLGTWFTSTQGRSLGFVTNGERAMVLLIEQPGDPGFHVVDPEAGSGHSHGFVIENGQVDAYPDRDTVPLMVAMQAVAHLVEVGAMDREVSWHCNR